MILYVHSDASHMSITKARRCAGGIYFLSDAKQKTTDYKTFVPLINGIIHVVCRILRNVMSSAAEEELGLLFVNAQYAEPVRTTSIETNRPQPPTPIQVENSISVGIYNEATKQRIYKATDM